MSLVESFNRIVQQRRTCKDFTGDPLPVQTLQKLVEWAIRSPNHHLNQPWRFTILERSKVLQLITAFETQLPPEDLTKSKKILARLSKVGGLIYVSVVRDRSPTIDEENFAAACAAVHTILLGAAAMELHSYWSTNALMKHEISLKNLQWVNADQKLVGAIWLGKAVSSPELTQRSFDDRIYRVNP